MYSTKDIVLVGIGPIFVCVALALSPITAPVSALAIVGLFLVFTWHLRGLIYAGVGIFLMALWQFIFFAPENPWWHLGLLGSLALSFSITALSGKLFSSALVSLHSQFETRGSALLNLEEELLQLQDTHAIYQVSMQDKLSEVQKMLEEMQGEHSSLLVLNEVLRKTSARHIAETETTKGSLDALQVRYDLMKEHQIALEKQLEHLQTTSAVVIENEKLLEDLQAARFEKEQTHLINETLARLHAKEQLRSQMLSSQEISLREELTSVTETLQETKALVEAHKDQLVQASREESSLREELTSVTETLQETKALVEAHKDQLVQASLQKEVTVSPSVDLALYVPKEELEHVQEKMKTLLQVDALYRQLKAQFEEKNKVLHLVRKDLFHAETTLETIKMEKEAQEQDLVQTAFPEIVQELGLLDEECARLQEENEELQRLVSVLNVLPPTMSPKKEKSDKKQFLQASFFEI